MATQHYVINDQGERVIPASRRPDGSWRKERKMKNGYTPQEEQAVYAPRVAQVLKSAPKVPGMDDSELKDAKATAKSKSAKKNERRKAKKGGEAAGPDAEAAAAILASVSLEERQPSSAPASPGNACSRGPPQTAQHPDRAGLGSSAAPATPAEALSSAEKLLRQMVKKVRQCDALRQRQAAGEALTGPERDKLAKLPAWQAEAKQLELEISQQQ